MNNPGENIHIVSYSEPITLVGGADCRQRDLETAFNLAPVVIAADGGAEQVLASGRLPERVIGDLDSLKDNLHRRLGNIIEHVEEQEFTDFEKCLLRVDASRVLAVGFMGGRIDHQLSVLNVMAKHMPRIIVTLSADDVSMMVSQEISFDLPVGTRLSLMPVGECRAWTEGLRWDLEGQVMKPDGFLSASNMVDGPVRIRAEGPVLLVLPSEHLNVLWDALSSWER